MDEQINNSNNNTIKLILIITGIFLVIGIGVLAFIFLNNPEPVEKCGDGICQEKERANPKLCREDCEKPSIECKNENDFCGGIAGIKCCSGLTCEYDGDYPDAGGVCVEEEDAQKTCSKFEGNICLSSETCSGSWLDASDSERCCDGGCGESKGSEIGFIGCSISHNAVVGYQALGGNDFWIIERGDETSYSGGSVSAWYNQLNKGDYRKDYWSIFEKHINENPNTKKIWWELCSSGTDAELEYADIINILEEIKRKAPGIEIYATPMPVFLDTSSGICVDNNGPQIIRGFVDRMIEEGWVEAGPILTYLEGAQTLPDGCHANEGGQAIWGQELMDFFDGGNSNNIPYSFFSVHCEEDTNPTTYYPYLKELVNTADSYSIPLTIMFNPSWINYILEDQSKIDEIHSWQANGHEIALHHHGPSHGGWNGYSNMPKEEAEALHKQWNPHSRKTYKGTVDDYFSKLKELAYPYEVKSGTVTDKWTDMPEEQIYDAEGRAEGRTSKAVTNIYNNHTTYRINLRAGYGDLSSKCKEEYNSLDSYDIYGPGGHVIDFAKNPEVAESWFKFLYEKDNKGAKRKTIAGIMEDYVLPNDLVIYEKCGNTICDSLEHDDDLCPDDCEGCEEVYRGCEFGDPTQIYLMGS